MDSGSIRGQFGVSSGSIRTVVDGPTAVPGRPPSRFFPAWGGPGRAGAPPRKVTDYLRRTGGGRGGPWAPPGFYSLIKHGLKKKKIEFLGTMR